MEVSCLTVRPRMFMVVCFFVLFLLRTQVFDVFYLIYYCLLLLLYVISLLFREMIFLSRFFDSQLIYVL